MTDEDGFAEPQRTRSMPEAVFHRYRRPRTIEATLESGDELGQVVLVNDHVDALPLQILGRVSRDRLDRPAVVERDASFVEESDCLLTLIDQRTKPSLALREAAPEPRTLARVTQ